MDTMVNTGDRQTYHHGNLRAALLEAAEQELDETGLESFSLRRVARQAGVSHNAPAHHFKDVQGLLTDLAATGFRRLLQVQTQHMEAAPDDEIEQFIALGLGYIEFSTSHPALFRLMFSSSVPDRNNADLADAMAAALDMLAQSARSARNGYGSTEPVDTTDLIAAWVMVHGFADLVNSGLLSPMLGETGNPHPDVARTVLRLLNFHSPTATMASPQGTPA